MKKEHIDLQFDRIISDLLNHSPSYARYDKNDNTITVTYSFNIGQIPKVKFRALRETWLKIRYQLLPDALSLEFIQSYLSRPSQKFLKYLHAYSDEYRDHFIGVVLDCINRAMGLDPLPMTAHGTATVRNI